MDRKAPSLQSFLEQGDSPAPRPGETGKTFKRRSSNINLQRSIKLLDEAVTPYVNRAVRTPKGNLRDSGLTPIRHETQIESDTQNLFLFTPGKKAKSVRSQTFDDTQNTTALRNTTNVVSFRQEPNYEGTMTIELTDVTLSNITIDEDPARKATQELYLEFKDSLKQQSALHQVLDLVASYESACAKQLSKIQQISKCLVRNQPKLQKTCSTGEQLLFEKNTWKLVHSLFKDRLESDAGRDSFEMDDSDGDILKTSVWGLSEQNISSRLFEKDANVRQSQLVVDWLETCAAEVLGDQPKNAKFFVDQPVAWENTLHNLQKSKQKLQTINSRQVTELDPDATLRQNKVLDDLDQEDERYFLQNLFVLIRAGQLEKAQELCHACGQPWRAATLEGWRLLHDPNYYAKTSSDISPLEGNPHRDVWKAVCWRLASEDNIYLYERAIYAALSGNLTALLPACSSWMDYVWAYFKVKVDVDVEKEIRLLHPTDRMLDSLPQEYTAKLLEAQEVFKEIAASSDENVRIQSENVFHTIQKYIILGDVPGLIETMYQWHQNRSCPPYLIRVLAHLVLFLRTIGQDYQKELCEAILKAYVEDLISKKHTSLVAHYVSKLNPEDQVQMYATFLEDIGAQEEQQKCLKLAEEEGLDVARITKTVVERIRMRENPNMFPKTSLAVDLSITEEDKAKIDAIQWLVFDEAHRPEAVRQANAIMRTFIAVKKHAAARLAFEKIPSDSIDVIYHLWHTKTGSSDLSSKDSNTIREYMCMKAYLDAVESFNDWFSLYHQGRPSKPAGAEGGSFTDQVAYEHKMKQFNQEYDRWMYNLQIQTRTTRDRIFNVLLFLDGGWLVDADEDPEKDASRQDQMSRLRKLHIPALCLNLHTVLHLSEMYVEAVQLADVIASEQYHLYREFDKESLQHLLVQISKSSLALLDGNKDPLGYDMV
ncbi:nuclear pore complex protein Nup107-like isoform X1 [Biomphalaria glabrata]|uniref:Nuclear pore complex protein n=2 Tax=Biomphalaria glabrata TaxID=6526 RepID=A0A9W2ZI27_BIOGL|nr:nuclear pore complex protein Nup107-like isoform X1 [Biomphalaria glabrata]